MQTVTKSILDYNQGRDPERLKIKLTEIRADPFAFFRGTCPLFYSSLHLDRTLVASPLVLACGDLHLENFASYKGDNRLVYFDLSDFDESCISPVAFELVRFLTSILVAAKPLKISDEIASKMVDNFIETYAANLNVAKPRWVERSIATGPVRKLLQGVKGRHRPALIRQRTQRKSGKTRLLIDRKKTLAASSQDRARAASILTAFASTRPSPAFYEPIDIARRIAGTGSLGLERYVALVRGDGGVDGRFLIDIKVATASALAANIGNSQPRWKNEADRVISIQRITQAISPALLGSVGVGKLSYLIKELQPSADRIDLASLSGKPDELLDVVSTMAEIVAWGHLRGSGRFGASSVDTLVRFTRYAGWRRKVTRSANIAKALVLQHWHNYSKDYDAGPDQLISVAAGKMST